MNWYPWLNPVYRQLATAWMSGQGHHALLLYGIPGTGTDELAYALTRLRMCQQPQGIKSCGECHSCKLMLAGTHPDFYLLQPEKGKSAIGIDAVRAVTEKLYEHAQQSGAKLVHIPQAELLTEAAANALLKTLEEPTENTWFVLQSQGTEQLLPTLRSRCFAYHLAPPSAETGLQWLQRGHPQSDAVSRQTALNLCHNAPAAALSLLTTADWQNRLNLFTRLAESVRSGDFLSLLSELNHQDAHQLADPPVYGCGKISAEYGTCLSESGPVCSDCTTGSALQQRTLTECSGKLADLPPPVDDHHRRESGTAADRTIVTPGNPVFCIT